MVALAQWPNTQHPGKSQSRFRRGSRALSAHLTMHADASNKKMWVEVAKRKELNSIVGGNGDVSKWRALC
jgi:hypothetical protein